MKKKKGFSLIELLVAMAIIAILLGLAGFGIATAQRNQRNAQRRQTVANIALAITDYQTSYNKLPKPNAFVIQTDKIVLETPTGQPFSQIPATGPSAPVNNPSLVNTEATFYCYKVLTNGYLLGAKMESAVPGSNIYHDASTDPSSNLNTNCDTSSMFP